MIKEAFEHRSGRVISLGRVMLASVFLFAIWVDPSQPSRYHAEAYFVLGGYVVAAAIYLGVTWSNWWLEARLAPVAHVADILLFGMVVFLTEGYTSPFFTFSVFILLSAMIKWGWRETGLTAAAVVLLFMIAGFAALSGGTGAFELARFLARGSHLFVLSLLLIWFGINMAERGSGSAWQVEADGAEEARPPVGAALAYALARTGGGRAVLAWWDKEEPWIEIATSEGGRIEEERRGFADFPVLVAPALEGHCFLFDNRRRRVLVRRKRHHRLLRLLELPLDAEFARRFGAESGLAVPFETPTSAGLLIVTKVPGLCSDDLAIGEQMNEAVSAAFDRTERIAQGRESAAAQTRLALARDLHDSVVQLLAGTAFRLEGIRKAAAADRDIAADVDALQAELAVEQRDLRTFIGELRENGLSGGAREGLSTTLPALLERMTRQWGIPCDLVRCPDRLPLAPRLDSEVQQLVREGVANAVRHGGATRVSVSLDAGERGVSLIIADNGSGFSVQDIDGAVAKPWSLNERVHQLAGDLRLTSSDQGTRLTISLPFHPERSPWQT